MKPIARVSCVVLCAALVAAPVLAVEKAPAAKKGAPAAKAAAAKPAPTVAPTATPAPKPVLVFFMNPAGRPCQMQDQLLAESRAQWEPLADLRYARTDTEADRDLFYRYGVRALPTLVLVDPAGKELKRFPPGIQQPTTVLDGLKATR